MNRLQMAHRFQKQPSEVAFRTRAYLMDWKFIICEGGFANIARATKDDIKEGNDRVWGAVYLLDPEEIAKMDIYEGVGSGLYQKVSVDLNTKGLQLNLHQD
jgi:hypothetical protein